MSPDLKDVLIATIPSILPALMVGIGILINKYDITTLRAEVVGLRAEVHSDMNAMRAQFHSDINGLRADIATLVSISNELDKRVTRLEDKS